MEQTLTGHLYSGQFRLATREDEQERHTLGGGFCPLHTWQYAAVASPLGISAGYAGLAASVADALDGLSGQGFAAADLARGVAALAAGPGTCPVCTALTGRERTAIAELISQVPPAPAALCLRHLALALSAGADARTGQALLRGLAARLRRDSEDMRHHRPDAGLRRACTHSPAARSRPPARTAARTGGGAAARRTARRRRARSAGPPGHGGR